MDIEIGTRLKRVRRKQPNMVPSTSISTSTTTVEEIKAEMEGVRLNTTEEFIEYILTHGPRRGEQSSTTKRYTTDGIEFSGKISASLYHIFGVGEEILGSSYRPKECNLVIGKITF